MTMEQWLLESFYELPNQATRVILEPPAETLFEVERSDEPCAEVSGPFSSSMGDCTVLISPCKTATSKETMEALKAVGEFRALCVRCKESRRDVSLEWCRLTLRHTEPDWDAASQCEQCESVVSIQGEQSAMQGVSEGDGAVMSTDDSAVISEGNGAAISEGNALSAHTDEENSLIEGTSLVQMSACDSTEHIPAWPMEAACEQKEIDTDRGSICQQL